MTDIETLRRAAAHIRDLAALLPDSPWTSGEDVAVYDSDGDWIAESRLPTGNVPMSQAIAAHIAAWHPGVTAAVADWLQSEADLHESAAARVEARAAEGWEVRISATTLPAAVAVARAVLGEQDGEQPS